MGLAAELTMAKGFFWYVAPTILAGNPLSTAGAVSWGADMPIQIFSSVEIRVVEVVAHEKRLCAIIFQSSLESRQGGNSVPACIVEIARVDVTREASVGDSVGVWVGDWRKWVA